MSQAGTLQNALSPISPTIPTSFVTNSGTAVPALNSLNVFGASVAAGSTPVGTTGAGSTVTVNVQTSQAIAASDATKIGLSAFNSTQFTVDANGFVSLAGGALAIDSIGTQTGVNPIVPTAGGLVTINGAVVAAGTNPVRSDGTGANTMAIEVQISQALAAADATKIGLSNFDSSAFAVDATGFVTLNPSGVLRTLTGNTGGVIFPNAGNINTVGTGSITIAGAADTLTTQLTGLTNHAVLIGAGTSTITKVGPVASTGAVLQSNGVGSDPGFSTATYPSITTVSQILYSSSTNVVAGLATANSATLVTTSAGVPVFSGTMTNGQMIIGSTGATPAVGTITSTGGTVTVTTGAGTLNLEVAGGGFAWTDVSGAFSPLKENGYFITGTATGTLPAAPAQGDTIKFFVDHASQVLTIQATAGKIIRLGNQVSSAAGTFVSTAQGDSLELTYRTSDTCWCSIAGFEGTWIFT